MHSECILNIGKTQMSKSSRGVVIGKDTPLLRHFFSRRVRHLFRLSVVILGPGWDEGDRVIAKGGAELESARPSPPESTKASWTVEHSHWCRGQGPRGVYVMPSLRSSAKLGGELKIHGRPQEQLVS